MDAGVRIFRGAGDIMHFQILLMEKYKRETISDE
jgi:hypothetical protein